MKNINKIIFIFSLSLILLLSIITTFSYARVRIIVRPWWPHPIVVAPTPPVYPTPIPPYIPPKYGYVDLNVYPSDAHVYIDGEYRGTASNFSCTPDCLLLVRGTYSITLKKFGYKTENFIIHVEPRKFIELDATLNLLAKDKPERESTYKLELEKTGYLELQVEPQDASVYIDGDFYGIASQFSKEHGPIVLPSGKHKIEIAKPGYITHTTHVEVSEDKSVRLEIKLQK